MNLPVPVEAKLAKLRPTQMTLGYAEVALKRKEWRERTTKAAKRFLRDHRFPAVRGPKGRYFIVDHHHLGRALQEENVASVTLALLADLSQLAKDEFWILMDFHQWAHPYDAKGRRRDFSSMPKTLKRMPDDPYRSLAAAVRRVGEYPKDAEPFAEFLWADFLRRRIDREDIEKHFKRSLADALKLAKSTQADYLPGWAGPIND